MVTAQGRVTADQVMIAGDVYHKLERKRLDLICANRVGLPGSGFESDDNALLVIDAAGEQALGPAPKAELAVALLDIVGERLMRQGEGG